MFHRIRSASRLVIGLAMFAVGFLLVGFSPGCQSVDTPHATFDRGGSTVNTPSPVILDSTDDSGRITSAGVGPSSFTSITEKQIQTFRNGSVPRDIFIKKSPDGSWQASASAGDNVRLSGVEIDPSSGVIKIANLAADTAEPIRAHNEAFDKLTDYWKSLPEDQKQARLGDLEAIKAAYPSMESVLSGLIKALTGGVAP